MKKILVGLLCFIPAITQAFFATTDDYQILEQSTIATVDGDFLDVTITEKIQGEVAITPLFGLPRSVESIKFFVDGSGISLTKTENKKRLTLLFDEASRIKQPSLFQFGNPKWPYLFSAKPFTITNNEPTITKLKYRIKLDFLDDIFYAELPEQKGVVTLVINRNKKIQHLLPICSSAGKTTRTDYQIVWQGQCDSQYPFKFYFSETPNPNLVYKTKDATYVAHLLDESKFRQYNKIHFIIDKSGSMYGRRWKKSKEVLLEMLGKIPSSYQVKVDFFDEILRPFNENFEPNSRENQKKLTNYFDTTLPLGKTNHEFLEKIYTDTSPETLVVLLGDFKDISPRDAWWKTGPKNPFVILSFNTNKNLSLWAKMTGGFFLSIFETQNFVKSDTFWQQLNHIFFPFLASNIADQSPAQHEFLPYQQSQYATGISNFFVSRSFDTTPHVSNITASFLPRLWGQRKLGSFIRKNIREGALSETERSAIDSISVTFGIRNNGQSKDFQTLHSLENANVLGVQNTLNNSLFIDHTPYYKNEAHYVAQNFNNTPTTLSISPFSAAQKKLFIEFPDIVSFPFAISKNVSFCHEHRCAVISEDGRTNSQFSDRLYWRGHHFNHWANQYIQTLSEKNIYKLTDDGDATPDQEITRAEFVTMAVEYQYGKDFEYVTDGTKFKDISDEYLQEVVALLAAKGVIRGYEDGTFRPERILSRAEAVKILLTMNGEIQPKDYTNPEALPFPDIGGWETFWVILAKEMKMVQGYGDGNFGPHDALTRGQAAKLIVENFNK